jgi:DNA-binding MarR family transcriptional regulator
MIKEDLKSELLQTMFRAKRTRWFFHGGHRRPKRRGHDQHYGHDFADPRGLDPHGIGPCDVGPCGADPHDIGPQGAVPCGIGPQDIGPCGIDPRGIDPHSFADIHDFCRESGFTVSTLEILRAIENGAASGETKPGETGEGGSGFAAELQARLHVSKAAISQNLMALEKKGLITRTVNPRDLRRFDFSLTEKGKHITAHLRHHMDRHLDEALEGMGEQDVRELIRLLNKFFDILEDMAAADEREQKHRDPRARGRLPQ